VAVQDGPLSDLKIDVFVPVHVKKAAAFAVRKKQGDWDFQLADSRVDSASHCMLRTFKQGAGLCKTISGVAHFAFISSAAPGEKLLPLQPQTDTIPTAPFRLFRAPHAAAIPHETDT
jgi:hypothetical protein